MPKLYILEDSVADQELYKAIFAKDYELHIESRTLNALEALEKFAPDAAILDLDLPDGDGLAVCQKIRNHESFSTLPIFVVSGDQTTDRKLMSLGLGADDFIKKPLLAQELKLKIANRLKRQAPLENLSVGPFKLNTQTQKLFVKHPDGERLLRLTSTEFKLLFLLMKNTGNVFTRASLLDAVWGNDLHVNDRTVDTHVSSLRRKCEPYGQCFESVYGEGYRFEWNDSEQIAA